MNVTSVKYRHFRDSGAKLVIGLRGRKLASCVVNYETGICLEKIDLREYDQMRDVPGPNGQPYDPKKAAEAFLAFTRRHTARRSITQGAEDVLQRILTGDTATLVDTEKSPDVAAASPEPATSSKVLPSVCKTLGLDPSKARRLLRAAGLHAPYCDAAKLLEVLGK